MIEITLNMKMNLRLFFRIFLLKHIKSCWVLRMSTHNLDFVTLSNHSSPAIYVDDNMNGKVHLGDMK